MSSLNKVMLPPNRLFILSVKNGPTRQVNLLHGRCVHARRIHSSLKPASAAPTLVPYHESPRSVFVVDSEKNRYPSDQQTKASSPLSNVPWSTLLRSLIVQHASSIPWVFRPSLAVLSKLSDTKSAIFSPDRNPALQRLLRVCFYDMFCAGQNGSEVARTTRSLQAWGVQGIMLCWAREVVVGGGPDLRRTAHKTGAEGASQAHGRQLICEWGAGNLSSVQLANSGDIVALKLSGAGPLVLEALQMPTGQRRHESVFLEQIHQICRLAQSKGVSLTIDAESNRLQDGIDELALSLARQYNGSKPGSSTVKNTYQAYLKSAAGKLSQDLEFAAREGFCLGVKLVRGAYLATETREIIWDTKEDTDAAYDGIAEGLMNRSWRSGGYLKGAGRFPQVDLVLATHNLDSVQKARDIRRLQIQRGVSPIPLVYAQLMGMADHVTAAAISASQDEAAAMALLSSSDKKRAAGVQKYLAWGTVGECMKYLVRRAEENKDAASRTLASRRVLWQEAKRRVLG